MIFCLTYLNDGKISSITDWMLFGDIKSNFVVIDVADDGGVVGDGKICCCCCCC